MKKLLGVFLTTIAFAYSGERLSLDLPSEMNCYMERIELDAIIYGWGSEKGWIEIRSEPREEKDYFESFFQKARGSVTIEDQGPSGVSLTTRYLEDDYSTAERLLLTDDYVHFMEAQQAAWLPNLLSAQVGQIAPLFYFEGPRWFCDQGVRTTLYDSQEGVVEAWAIYDSGDELILMSEPQKNPALSLAEYSQQGSNLIAFDDSAIDLELIEEDQNMMLFKVNVPGVDDELNFLRLSITPTSLNQASISGTDEESLIEVLKNLEIES